MGKHIILVSPHDAMIDWARLHHIAFTILDTPERKAYYQTYPTENLFLYNIYDAALSAEIVQSIDRHRKIDAVITLTENALLPAAKLCACLGGTRPAC